MMTRLAKSVPWPATAITIATALTITVLTGAGRIVAQSKLDTPRFVADSTNRYWEQRDLRATLSRMDTTLQLICARTDCHRAALTP